MKKLGLLVVAVVTALFVASSVVPFSATLAFANDLSNDGSNASQSSDQDVLQDVLGDDNDAFAAPDEEGDDSEGDGSEGDSAEEDSADSVHSTTQLPKVTSTKESLKGLGSGTAADPVVISTPAQFALFAHLVNKGSNALAKDILGADTHQNDESLYFALLNDIDLSSLNWAPIGTYAHRFDSHFDGRGHTVFGLSVNNVNSKYSVYAGLFGYADSLARINSVNIFGARINVSSSNGGVYAGGLVGYSKADITGVNVCADINAQSNSTQYAYVGGVAGKSAGSLTAATANGHVLAETAGEAKSAYAGGLVGVATGGIYNSNAFVTVSAHSHAHAWSYAGGLVARTNSIVDSSIARGDASAVSDFSYAAYSSALVAYSDGYVVNSQSFGNVESTTKSKAYSGSIVGYAHSGSIAKNFAASCTIKANGALTFVHRVVGSSATVSLSLNTASQFTQVFENGVAVSSNAGSAADGTTV